MKWQKLGLLYRPDPNQSHEKLYSHAANPLPILLENDVYRVFFNGRDQNNKSSVGAVDIDIVKQKVIRSYYEPFFECGPKENFYSDGISIGNCYECSGNLYMLFMGWKVLSNSQWKGEIGRLIVNKDLTLSIVDDNPILALDDLDPLSLSYPWVMRSLDSFIMWYGSTVSWDAGNKEMLHILKSASSSDGEKWIRNGLCIPYKIGKAQAFSRPSVLMKDDGTYEMWFSYRGSNIEKYKIGYATSQDGKSWQLKLNQSGIATSSSGWDSEMVAYPFVFKHKENRYMLYNGNGYGRTGFGLAIEAERS